MSASSIVTPEPQLTPLEMIQRAIDLRPFLRERQALCEQQGRLPDETNEQFLKAGFYRTIQPRMFGGYEFSLRDFVRVMSEVSRGCPESGWVLALTAGHPAAFLSGFDVQAQIEVYGSDGDVRVPGVATPGGTAIPVEGGYRVKGAWDYASGCDVSTHFLGGAMKLNASGRPESFGYLLFDRAHFTIVDNWNVWAMQGTGSRRVEVQEMFLPAHRFMAIGDATMKERYTPPGRAIHKNPLYHGDIVALLIFEVAAVVTGAARGSLDLYEQILRERKLLVPPFTPRAEVLEYQGYFGHSQGLIDTAEHALLDLADSYEEYCRTEFTPESARRIHRGLQQCIELSWEAVELMFRTGGSSCAAKSSLLGRHYRDIAVIRTHQTLQHHHTGTNAARLHLGLPPLSAL